MSAGPLAVLAFASLLSGAAESGILAVLAQTAASLVEHQMRATVSLGPVRASLRLSALLALGLGCALVRLTLQGVLAVVPARISGDTQARWRREVFDAFTRASWTAQSRDAEGRLQEIVTNQATQAGQCAGYATGVLISGLTFAVLIVSSLVLNAVAALVVLVTAGGLFAVLRPLSSRGHRYARGVSQASVRFAEGVNESVRVAEETHVFGTGDAQRKRVDALVEDIATSWFDASVLILLLPGLFQSLVYIFVLLGVVGIYAAGGVPVASLGAVILVLVRAGSYGQQLQSNLQRLRQSIPYLEQMQGTARSYARSAVSPGLRALRRVDSVACRQVSYTYDGEHPVLDGIDFEVPRGCAVSILGPSGAGKSTLAQILLGLRTPTSGAYLVNGVDSATFLRADWHRRFAYLPQEPRLLHASVAENIRFFRDLDDTAVRRAAELAGIHDDVARWASGYDTLIGPRADAISGGQQQRVCLARALAADPDVLVLDEPTSALDPQAEQRIQEALAGLKHRLTLFIVGYRLSTVEICDQVMVIVDGRLDGFDSVHAMSTSSRYYRSVSALDSAFLVAGSRA